MYYYHCIKFVLKPLAKLNLTKKYTLDFYTLIKKNIMIKELITIFNWYYANNLKLIFLLNIVTKLIIFFK